MKRFTTLAMFLIFFSLTACGDKEEKSNIIEIKERMFVQQCNDIYLNPDEYKDKIIKIEGMYDEYDSFTGDEKYSYVVRYGPGCCGDDGLVGFEFIYDGDIPKVNDWIQVLGTLDTVDEGDYEYIVLKALEVNVLDVRGEEFVVN